MTMDDTDTQAIRIRGNLNKARKAWKMISRLLRRENMKPRVCGMFFKAVVQAVLLYGSETWVLMDSALRCLEGFFYRAACRMANGEWRGRIDRRRTSRLENGRIRLRRSYLRRLGCIL